ncbi:MBL fold metallo-hydrolase [Gilvimarinus polysaccharolyticus]|uniref:MBL fold metallo-hydrolase n=1 Tax=Gilvimarinus polysaccharolyticus TaxID=863921 RepID=UPI0006738B7B|nr:MBL fold metallo-hydrolase [Gilvimarinus polysaccharolyticus]
MRVASLGSGSRGNATIVEWTGERSNGTLLIDCGFSVKETCARLERLGKTAHDLTAVLVTHEHADHIKGVAALARRFNLPVYMTPGTYHSRDLGKLPELHLIEAYQSFCLGDMTVEPVAVPHDAREPAQFIFSCGGVRLGVLTDLGTVSPHVEDMYQNCDALVLEANHDPMMLASGPYPPSLKTRVGGPWGHLSNQQTAGFLARVDCTRLQYLVIAHISQKNNSIERAREALLPVTANVAEVIYAGQDEGFDWLSLTAGPVVTAASA